MGENTKIAWTNHTFNPWWGCTKVSEGCEHCYAEGQASRWGVHCFGPEAERVGQSTKYWNLPLRWNRKAAEDGVRPRVFCGSMCDLFEEVRRPLRFKSGFIGSPVDERLLALDLIEHADRLDWLLCTKRPENVMRMVPTPWKEIGGFPRNVWMLVTTENQARLIERGGILLDEIPARVRGLSVEPMLGPLDLDDYVWPTCRATREVHEAEHGGGMWCNDRCLDWVILGAESGEKRRACPLEWVESAVEQCRAAGVACFVKQLDMGGRLSKDPEEWPEHLRVREFPGGLKIKGEGHV